MYTVGELETLKKILRKKSAEVDKLPSDIAEKESTEAELQQNLKDIQDDKTQVKVSLQKKESECGPDESMCEEHTKESKALYTLS